MVEQSYVSAIDLRAGFGRSAPSGEAPGVASSGAMVPNFFRTAVWSRLGAGGNAGYNRDFITAQGMLDAFRDAEYVRGARSDQVFHRRALVRRCDARYQRDRDTRVLAMYEFTCQLATLVQLAARDRELFSLLSMAIRRQCMHLCG